MKGISTILAMILIVIIVVALIGLTYTFAIGLFQTTTAGATDTTNTVTSNMQKSISVVSARCDDSDNNVIFTIRNTGTQIIAAAEVDAFFDNVLLTLTDEPATLAVGALSGEITGVAVGPTFTADTTYTLKVSAPAGEVPYQVTCVA